MGKTCPNGQELKLSLNGELTDADAPATSTVLEFVRARGLTGTKEGCASGDCGACTVMLRQTSGDATFRTANACILPLGQVAGREVITVEGLADEAGLHPAQKSLVDCHGSQCGFCTPGFVMSLAALVENGETASRDTVLQGISGNLCRCTGYKPIVEAGLKALAAPPRLGNPPGIPGEAAALPDCVAPANESELQALIKTNPQARLIAGGTDLMLEVTQQYKDLPGLIDVSRVEELCQVDVTDTHLIIGAAVSYSHVEARPEISKQLLALLHRLGSRQIRNAGTIGGNLANGSPIADMPPVLMIWDADIEIVNSDGQRRSLRVSDFYHGYRDTDLAADEYISSVVVPRSAISNFHRFYKNSKRIEDDISSVMGAFRFTGNEDAVHECRIAFGGMAATPVRLVEIEQMLAGRSVSDKMISEAKIALAQAMTPMSDVRASADYRREMACVMLERALREFRGEDLAMVTEL